MKSVLLTILLFAAPAHGQQAAIRYVSGTGKDSNDSLSCGSSKATVFAALFSLPGGNVVGPFSGSGTVYVAPGSALTPTANAGVWIMAPHDPKYSSPPAGWLKCNACNINIADRAIMVMVAAQTRIRIGSWQVWKKGQPPGYLVRNCPSISLILDSSIANTELCHWRVFGWQSDRHMRSLWSSSGNVTAGLANQPNNGACTD